MSKWEKVRIGEISNQIRGVSYSPQESSETPQDNYSPILRAHNIQDEGLNYENLVFVDSRKISDKQYIKAGDIVICASSGSKNLVGKAAQANKDMHFAFGAFCKVVRPCININAKYLGFYFRSKRYREIISALSAGANINNLRNEHIDDLSIPVPPLVEQQKIADTLDDVADLLKMRKQQLADLGKLVKSQFIEMFGDYPTNQKGWNIGVIRDVVSDVRYGTSRPSVDGGKYPYLRMNNITYDGELDLADTKQIDLPDKELDKCTVRYGDVLFNRTNSKELVGKTCVYNRDEMMVLAGFVIRVRVNDRMVPEFLSAYLNTDFSKAMLLGMCKAAIGQANINATEMQRIGLYIPPIDFQKQFVLFKERVDKSKIIIQQSIDQTQALLDSLMSEYFD